MALTVHHYFPLGSSNIGDGLVARAIREAVGRHFGACDFVDFPANDRYPGRDRVLGLRGENLERTNAEADLVIVGGSNMLEARKPRRDGIFGPVSSGWGVFTDLSSIERLSVPLLMIGMGTDSSFGRKVRPYLHPALDEIRLLHEKAFGSAVRDLITVSELAKIGVRTRCTGCPVTFLTDRPIRHVEPVDLPLLVSFPPPRIIERFGGRTFMRQSMRYIRWVHDQGTPLVVTLHDMEDVEPARKWVPRGVEIFCSDDLNQLIARFEASRGVIGFRLHAALLGLALGKPVIAVGVDWRGIAFINTFRLADFSIGTHWPGQFAKLRYWTTRLLDGDSELIDALDRGKTHYRARYERFLTEAAMRYCAGGPSSAADT